MKLTVLIENKPAPGRPELAAEHGLSVLVETEAGRVLLDTGTTGAFAENAKKLGLDLSRLDGVVISHNHYDHIGGIRALLGCNHSAPIYLRREARRRYYRCVDGVYGYHGEPEGVFEEAPERFVFLEEDTEILPGVWVMHNQVQDKSRYCRDRARFCRAREDGSGYEPDDFTHEQFLCIRGKEGMTVLSSCSHNGIVNILESVRRRFGEEPVCHVVGGFHMMAHRPDANGVPTECMNCPEDFARQMAQYLRDRVSDGVYTCHCTGSVACANLAQVLGDRIRYIPTGTVLEWE